MDHETVRRWLDAYGKAWVDGDPEQVVALFTPAATYRETPFDAPMQGHDAIRRYWQAGAAEAQEDVAFSAQVWAVAGDTAIAGWQAQFARKATGARIALDGVFRLRFAQVGTALLCDRLEEWWHRRET